MNKMFTKEDAMSYANSIRTKGGQKWEGFIQNRLVKAGYLPAGDLNGSIFKTAKFTFKIDEDDDSGHQKLSDFFLPRYNHLIEAKESLSDSTEQAIAFSVQTLINTNEYGNDFKFILLIDKKPAPAMLKRLMARANKYSKYFEYRIGEAGVNEYIDSLKQLETEVETNELPMGTIEWVDFDNLIDNDKNRDINMPHVYNLVDSLLAQTRGGSVRGLLRTFIGFKHGKKIHLVDAHHCKMACTLINKYTKYHINQVPVYVLDHLSHLTEEELTTLMSVINTLVLKWETFQYVKIWEKTFRAIGDTDRLFPYEKLRESMEDLSEHLKQDSPNSAPILQAFCLSSRAEESNWSQNTKKVNYGELMFDKETYENKLKPIVKAVKKLANKIENIRKVVGSSFKYKGEEYNTPTKNVALLRGFATELSLQEKERSNHYYDSLNNLANGYWDNSDLLPLAQDVRYFEREDLKALYEFPTTGDEMKKFVEERILPESTKMVKKGYTTKIDFV
jgi:hypothetical protein